MKKVMMLGAALLAMQALPAFAQDGGPKPEGMRHGPEKFFEKQDTDKDGFVSEAEFLASAKEKFGELDANKDGKVSKDELQARHDTMKKKWEERKAAKGAEGKTEAPKAE